MLGYRHEPGCLGEDVMQLDDVGVVELLEAFHLAPHLRWDTYRPSQGLRHLAYAEASCSRAFGQLPQAHPFDGDLSPGNDINRL